MDFDRILDVEFVISLKDNQFKRYGAAVIGVEKRCYKVGRQVSTTMEENKRMDE